MDINSVTGKTDARRSFPALRMVFLAAWLFLGGGTVFSQQPPPDLAENAFFVRETEEGARLVQRLSWPGDENARYEVVVEQLENGEFRKIIQEAVEENFFDVSLGPGNYRYQVLFYNLLYQFEYATNWASFNIILALRPELHAFAPPVFYQNEDRKFELTITGRNLIKNTRLYLVPLAGGQEHDGGAAVMPKEYIPDPSGESALLVFTRQDLRLGRYAVYAQNPGGLEASLGTLDINFGKPFDLNLQGGYSFLVPFYGYLFDDLFDTPFYPAGARMRVSYVPFKRIWGYLGVELNPWWNYLSGRQGGVDAAAQLWGIQANGLYKKLLPNRIMSLNARAGMGISFLSGLSFDYGSIQSDPVSSWSPSLSAGLSFQWYIYKSLFLELGTDYVHIFSRDNPQPGLLNASLEAGWRF
jgi:hypothetical protein